MSEFLNHVSITLEQHILQGFSHAYFALCECEIVRVHHKEVKSVVIQVLSKANVAHEVSMDALKLLSDVNAGKSNFGGFITPFPRGIAHVTLKDADHASQTLLVKHVTDCLATSAPRLVGRHCDERVCHEHGEEFSIHLVLVNELILLGVPLLHHLMTRYVVYVEFAEVQRVARNLGPIEGRLIGLAVFFVYLVNNVHSEAWHRLFLLALIIDWPVGQTSILQLVHSTGFKSFPFAFESAVDVENLENDSEDKPAKKLRD